MEILQRIIADMISRGEVKLTLSTDTVRYLENRCFEVLARIREILADDELDDRNVFRESRKLCVNWKTLVLTAVRDMILDKKRACCKMSWQHALNE